MAATAEEMDDLELYTYDGYRLYRYRSPTPASSDYAETLSTAQVVDMLRAERPPLLIDVQPLTWNRVFIQQEPRRHIPGSVWLPNVGRGELDEDWEHYFSSHLERLTEGNRQREIIIYCRADCWMSWNAVKRASGWGYNRLYWYRDGSDGWIENDQKTVQAEPLPFSETQDE
ncbi:rhodanese-like domain-containing protein [Neptuniibacter halophilus]|uniref:rhodanese-like domain-containing protein n=1 Tax=Neptuniibacter halophilus TaxID=651666 RepID=UPI002572340C|nr:rhodanese-like domain-containing protein [Neptuniibacter halophilus]